MILQPEWGSRNVTSAFYEFEAEQISRLNEVFGNVELNEREMRSLVWIAGGEESTVNNLLSAIRKVLSVKERKT